MRLTIAFLAALCLPASGQIGRGVNFYSAEKEIALGQGLAQEFERHSRMLEDAAVRQYIQTLGDRLVAKLPAGSQLFPYFFRVMISSNTGTHEPSALPGGFIFVPTSLIVAAEDEAELAGMLAHAIAHVAARHGTRQETRGQIAGLAEIPMIFMGGGWQGYGLRQASQVSVPLGFLTFARGFEKEADKIAVTLLAEAGYDPSALLRYIDRTQLDAGSTQFSAMPSRGERLENLRQAIAQLTATTTPTAPAFGAIQEIVRQVQ